jgi:hypothetical protein
MQPYAPLAQDSLTLPTITDSQTPAPEPQDPRLGEKIAIGVTVGLSTIGVIALVIWLVLKTDHADGVVVSPIVDPVVSVPVDGPTQEVTADLKDGSGNCYYMDKGKSRMVPAIDCDDVTGTWTIEPQYRRIFYNDSNNFYEVCIGAPVATGFSIRTDDPSNCFGVYLDSEDSRLKGVTASGQTFCVGETMGALVWSECSDSSVSTVVEDRK